MSITVEFQNLSQKKLLILDFTVKEKVNIKDKQAKTQIHMFCFSMYCDYEWD